MARKRLPKFVAENMKNGSFSSTVEMCIHRVLPFGTKELKPRTRPDWSSIPRSPEDVFAAVGMLLESSGTLSFFGVASGKPHKDFPKLALANDDLEECTAIGKAWNDNPTMAPAEAQNLWSALLDYGRFPLSYQAYRFNPIASRKSTQNYWWSIAFKLFVLSDVACNNVGFAPASKGSSSLDEEMWSFSIQALASSSVDTSSASIGKSFLLPSSLAPQADADVVCVKPKSLIPRVGSGTRVFSSNLALLPPRGLVRTQWIVGPENSGAKSDSGLNILALPFPYRFSEDEFDVKEIAIGPNEKPVTVFKLKQSWLEDEPFAQFLRDTAEMLTECSQGKGRTIHGIVLPELALNKERFGEFAEFVKSQNPSLEFIVSGTSENCESDPVEGNYVWTRRFIPQSSGRHEKSDAYIEVSQSKHHRWNLNGEQIKGYSLDYKGSNGLSEASHWENFAGRPRELNFVAYRRKSVFCSIVCEDLARSEPCHEIIRAVGPNLIFALLMDGPQIEQRWGAKYASLFSDDHGCAVMTLSSLALVGLSQRTQPPDRVNHSVLYFRSPEMSEAISVKTDVPGTGVLLRLTPDRDREGGEFRRRETIYGRMKEVVEWKLAESPQVVGVDGA